VPSSWLLAVGLLVAAGDAEPVRTFGSTRFRSDRPVTALAMGPDARSLFTLGVGGAVGAWNLNLGTARRLGPADSLHTDCLSADGRFPLGTDWAPGLPGRTELVRLDTATGERAALHRLPPWDIDSVHRMPGDRQAVVTGFGGRVGLFDLPPWPAAGGKP
jgi:hypothetical protein